MQMASSNKYFHDRVVLLLLSTNAFLLVLTILSVLFRLQGSSDSFIVQYRSNLGASAFQPGGVGQILNFIVFAVVVCGINTALSWRTYAIRRELSVIVLAMGTLLLLLGVIASNALLKLH
jgi:hypothetical protein